MAATEGFASTLGRVEGAQAALLAGLIGAHAPGLGMGGAGAGAGGRQGGDALLCFLRALLARNRGSTRDIPPAGLSGGCGAGRGGRVGS